MSFSKTQYESLVEISRGPGSACYRAIRSSDGITVILYDYGPLPTATALPGTTLAERLNRKLSAATDVAHPALPAIVDFGLDDNHYLVALEQVEGTTLETLLVDQPRVPYSRVREILATVLAAIRELEARGWCHGDIHPGAIVVGSGSGTVRLKDIGIPSAFRELQPEFGDSPTAYRSPERLAGLDLDARSDQYSVGVLLYRMLSGELPSEPIAPLQLPDLPPEISDKLTGVTRRACKPEPSARYGGATAMATAIAMAGRLNGAAANDASSPARGIRAASLTVSRGGAGSGTIWLLDCPACRQRLSSQAAACPHCGHPIRPVAAGPPAPLEGPDLSHLNWGGCLLALPWSIANHVWEGLFAVLGLGSKTLGWMVQVGVGLYLLGNGNRLAWNSSRKWESVDQFYRVQRRWAVAGVLVAIGSLILVWLYFAGVAASQGNRFNLGDEPGGLEEWLRRITPPSTQ